MNTQVFLALKFLRQLLKEGSDFERGYALGHMNTIKYDLEPWERQYLEVIANRIVWGGKAA